MTLLVYLLFLSKSIFTYTIEYCDAVFFGDYQRNPIRIISWLFPIGKIPLKPYEILKKLCIILAIGHINDT